MFQTTDGGGRWIDRVTRSRTAGAHGPAGSDSRPDRWLWDAAWRTTLQTVVTWEGRVVATCRCSGCPFEYPAGWVAVKRHHHCIENRNNALTELAQPGLQDSDCGNGGSLGSQDSWPQGNADDALLRNCGSSSSQLLRTINSHTSPLLCNGTLLSKHRLTARPREF
jgi:hypothetical protein